MQELDLSGLKCPMPVLRTQKALAGLHAGDRLAVVTTDPLASLDLPSFCGQKGHRLVSSQQIDGTRMRFVVEKG
ncbi:sulfurtransferase TusA family protein [uncultured Cohaesibacter sp.]|uniref:sulfurtransferase TusA family protein n=1 Tax=uncultured Cohaesibacter sp. TaxID=1002546 RepID=UPI0029C67A36|nr:sulfurtransferase TusA family protein [uncultured Cohaesibacter sp.]